MKALTLKIVFPLTVISFAVFTKWWYALPVDARDTLFWGFPFAYVGEGWHTSMSLQFFLLELFIDLFIYFLCWCTIVFCLNILAPKIKPHKVLTQLLWLLAIVTIAGYAIIIRSSDSVFHLRRPYDMEIMDSGCKFIWQSTKRPEYYQYHPDPNKL
ncbi:MAG: hypothetical protein K1X61_08830 [Chitinophagales bacterium]|nr:hypothetical protein [Chitinophagales bacterium]